MALAMSESGSSIIYQQSHPLAIRENATKTVYGFAVIIVISQVLHANSLSVSYPWFVIIAIEVGLGLLLFGLALGIVYLYFNLITWYYSRKQDDQYIMYNFMETSQLLTMLPIFIFMLINTRTLAKLDFLPPLLILTLYVITINIYIISRLKSNLKIKVVLQDDSIWLYHESDYRIFHTLYSKNLSADEPLQLVVLQQTGVNDGRFVHSIEYTCVDYHTITADNHLALYTPVAESEKDLVLIANTADRVAFQELITSLSSCIQTQGLTIELPLTKKPIMDYYHGGIKLTNTTQTDTYPLSA